MDTAKEQEYWTERYNAGNTGWDIGYPSAPIKAYVDQLETDKDLSILIPGAGNAYEAEYIHRQGYTNVNVLDISTAPLKALQRRVPSFPISHLRHGNFFDHEGQYDLIIEQTFFCSFEPTTTNRESYARKMHSLLKSEGLLVGLWFDIPLVNNGKRPFGGSKEEYVAYFTPYFDIKVFERCYNSIPPRAGNELFAIMKKL